MRDTDTRLPHSLGLELSAEAGVAAGALAVLLLLLLTVRPVLGTEDPLAIVATLSVAVFAIQSAIDYTHHFPAVVFVVAAIAGLTTDRTPTTSRKPAPADRVS
jgi:hypothetical protein